MLWRGEGVRRQRSPVFLSSLCRHHRESLGFCRQTHVIRPTYDAVEKHEHVFIE